MNSPASTTAAKTAVLTSWKDIANYMCKSVRTVQRWEQDFGLPVRRPTGSSKKAILARPRDLDAWVALRCSRRAESTLDQNYPAPPIKSLTSMNVEIQTSRQLRDHNKLLMNDVKSALRQCKDISSLFKPAEPCSSGVPAATGSALLCTRVGCAEAVEAPGKGPCPSGFFNPYRSGGPGVPGRSPAAQARRTASCSGSPLRSAVRKCLKDPDPVRDRSPDAAPLFFKGSACLSIFKTSPWGESASYCREPEHGT
jgi:hypothetical protein